MSVMEITFLLAYLKSQNAFILYQNQRQFQNSMIVCIFQVLVNMLN